MWGANMAGVNANPSQNPADLGTLAGTIRLAFRKLMQATDGMLPATVIAVDAARNYATVQPNIAVKATDGVLTDRAQIAKVPILTMGAGNFVMSFPVAPGDVGWIVAADRDISLYLQGGKPTGPNTNRLHSFSDGLFISDKAREWVLADEDAANAVWQSLDGTVKIAIGPDSVRVVHPDLIELDAPSVTISGTATVAGGFGAFGTAAPGAKPAITGQLSGVTDVRAKAVLTSIIAVLVGNGSASDGTT